MDNFLCEKCGKEVEATGQIGTKNRNHCPFCLWSKHVDKNISGDREETCHGLMEPIALTFKEEGTNKYGEKNQGEIMLIHQCEKCNNISINRVAADDDNQKILEIFEGSKKLDQNILTDIEKSGIDVLSDKDLSEINRQLFGK